MIETEERPMWPQKPNDEKLAHHPEFSPRKVAFSVKRNCHIKVSNFPSSTNRRICITCEVTGAHILMKGTDIPKVPMPCVNNSSSMNSSEGLTYRR
jgi:hypothetical protein